MNRYSNIFLTNVLFSFCLILVVSPFSEINAQLKQLSGVVLSEDKKPIPGVTIEYLNSDQSVDIATSTDKNGKFVLFVPELTGFLQTGSIGYKEKTVFLEGSNYVSIFLEVGHSELEEVIVSTGYQKIERKLFTGAYSSLSMDKINLEGVPDISKSLEGKVAGVALSSPSATFGAAPKIKIRGTTSLYGNSTPLFVIDGVVNESVIDVSVDDLSSGNANTILSSGVAGLNANDIESFQILKDASATSLYGARAANGVIVITTKSGTYDAKTSISYNNNITMRVKPSYSSFNIMNSADQMDFLLDLYRKGRLSYSTISVQPSGGVFLKMYDQLSKLDPNTGEFVLANTALAKSRFLIKYGNANTDWFDILFTNNILQTHSVSVSSGGKNSSLYSSLSYMHDGGQTVADNVERITATFKENIRMGKKVRVGIQFNASIRNQKTPSSETQQIDVVRGGTPSRNFELNPYFYAINTSRTIRAYDDNGDREYFKRNYADFNVLHEFENNYAELRALDLLVQLSVQYKITRDINYQFTGSVRYNNSNSKQIIKESSNYANAYRQDQPSDVNSGNILLYTDPDNLSAPKKVVLPVGGFYRQTIYEMVNYYLRNTLNWNKKIKGGKHEINVFLGQELRYLDRDFSFSTLPGVQYDNGLLATNFDPLFYAREKQLGNGTIDFISSTVVPKERSLSYFMTVAYNFDKRYTFNLTGRYDGSNRLGKSINSRWLPTWNISAAWSITEERFMTKFNKVINHLRLRMTYGLSATTGPTENALALFEVSTTYRSNTDDRENQIEIESLENSELTWEKQYEFDVGLDIGLFQNKFTIIMDYYIRNGFDIIGTINTSGIGGEITKFANYADTKSEGFELALGLNNLLSKYINGFGWDINYILSTNESIVTSLDFYPRITDITKITGDAVVSYPIRGIFSLPFQGLDERGVPSVLNEYGNPTSIDEDISFQSRVLDYLKYEGSVDPTLTGGLTNTFRYKGFQLSVFVSYQFGNKVRIPSHYISNDYAATTTSLKNRWLVPGDEKITNVPVLPDSRLVNEYGSSNLRRLYGAYALSDVFIADGSFIRLKDISLSYIFNRSLISKIGVSSLSIKLSATNLFLLYSDSKLKGLDPEFVNSGGVALPIQGQYTLTMNIVL